MKTVLVVAISLTLGILVRSIIRSWDDSNIVGINLGAAIYGFYLLVKFLVQEIKEIWNG